MPAKKRPAKLLEETKQLVEQFHGNISAAARHANIPRPTLQARWEAVRMAREEMFETPELPEEIDDAETIIARRQKQYAKTEAAERARILIPITVKIDGPVGIVHMGDPHLDDDGMNMPLLTEHIEILQKTYGLMAGNVGDSTNNWVGRLAHLYGNQATTAREALALAEWLFTAIPWLYVVGGNHDVWSGDQDLMLWLAKFHGTLYQWHGARLELRLPSGRTCRVNARHDFQGHSMWNTAHGPGKAVQMGWRDHILTCGHKHVSGYQILKDPATGLISHAIRVGTYKQWDSYAKKLGLPNQNAFPSCVTIIDPAEPEDSCRFVTMIPDVREGAEFLTWKRRRGGFRT